jgi:hypothetical protein
MRSFWCVLVVVVVGLAPVAAAAPTAPASSSTDVGAIAVESTSQVTITVSVTDENGDPVSGANVTVSYDGTEQTGETFANGKAFFDVPDGADVTVDVSASDLALNRPTSVSNVDAETTVDVQLFPAATALVSVQTPNGEAVEGATVRLRKDGEVLTSASGETAANGTFVASGIERGNYTVSVRSAGYYSTQTSFVVANRAGKTVELEPGTASVTFTTVDGHFDDDRAVSANVVLFQGETQLLNLSTGSSGARSVSLDVNTRYRVVVKKSGYQRETQVLTTGERDSSVTYAINRTPSLTVTPANSQVVTGQTVRVSVTDEYDEPVEGASISVGGDALAETDANGEATVTIEDAGTVEVVAERGSLSSSATVEGVAPGGDSTTVATTEPPTEPPTTEPPTTEPPTTEPVTTGSEEGSGPFPTPGFGGVAALLAVALSVAALARRRAA